MATAGSIVIDLLARTGSFESDMDRAAKRVKATGKEIDSTAAALGRFAAAAGAAGLAFASMAAGMAMHSARSMDATAKMAEQIGTTTEALTGLRFAAQQFADVSDKTFDMALRRMTRRIEEAAAGSGGAKNALDALGLSAKQLAQMSPDQQFLVLADAMKNTESQAQRLRHTMAIFDTEGMPLVAALQRGSEEMERHIEIARRFGLVLSTEAAQAASDFTDNIKALTDASSGIKQQVAEAVLPSLVAITDRLVEISKSVGPVGEKVEIALKTAGAAAAATAIIFASRLTAAAYRSVAGWVAATGAAAAHQAQLAQLSAAISGTSASMARLAGVASGSMAAVTRAGSLALGVLGGGAGLLVTVGLTAAAFLAMGRDAKAASVDIDDLSESFKTLSAQKLELRLFDLEDEVQRLEDQARQSGEILRTMEADALALADAQGVTAEELENLRRSLLEQRDAHATNNAELDRARTLLNQVIDHLERMRGAAHGAAGGVNALNQAMHSEAGEKYLAQIQGRIKALQDAGDPIKIASRYIAEHTELTEADRVAIMSAAHAEKALIAARDAAAKATKAGTNAINEAKRAAEAFRREQDQGLRAQLQAVSAIHQQAGALEDQVLLFGQSKTALEDLTIARLEEQAAMLRGFDGSQEQVEAIEREIEARQRLRTAIGSLEQKEAERQQWQSWSRDVEQIFQQVGQSLTDQLFEGGKSARDLIKDLFKTLTLRVLIQPVMGGLQGLFMGAGPAGIANAGSAAGMMGSPTSLFSMFGGNSMGMGMSNVMSHLSTSSMLQGTGVGNWLMGQAGNVAGMSNLALGGAGLLGGLGANLIFGGKGHSGIGGGLGSTLGMALGGPIGAVAGTLVGGGLGSLFGDREPTTRRMQRNTAELIGGQWDITSRDSRQDPAAAAAARELAQTAVQTANDIFRQVGIDAAIESFYAITESSYKRDREGVASGGQLRIGDRLADFGVPWASDMTLGGFGGWSDAEMLPRLATDIQLSVLEAFQKVRSDLPTVLADMLSGVRIRDLDETQAAELAQRFSAIVQEVSAFQTALEQLPFAQLRDLSFDAAANILNFAGGLENLSANLGTYFENFYTQEEQLQFATEQLGKAFSDLGLELPDVSAGAETAKQAYRDIVESLDLNTESGQQAYATLINLSGGFAELVTGLDELNNAVVETARSAADIARERYNLETQLLQLQGNTAELRRRELEVLDESNHALQEHIWALQDQAAAQEAAARAVQEAWSFAVSQGESAYSTLARAISAEKTLLQKESQDIASTLRDAISHASNSVRELERFTGRLSSTVNDMMRSALDDGRNYAWAQQRVERALSVARLTGVMPTGEDFEQALQIVAQPSEQLYDSFEDYQADFLRTAHAVSELNKLADGQLFAERRTLSTLEEQLQHSQIWYQSEIERLDLMLEHHREQLDIAMGTYEAVLTIPEAIAGVRDAIANLQMTPKPPSQGSSPSASWDDLYLSAKLAELQNKGAVSHGIDWQSGTINDLAAVFASEGFTPELHYELYGKDEGIDDWIKQLRGFAVGTNYVPYDMVARIHEGERIIPAADNREMMQMLARGVDRDNTIRLLQQEIRELRLMMERKLDGVERNTGDAARTNRQMVEQRQIVQVEGPVATVLVEDRTA